MAYVEGFVVAVPTGSREAYARHAAEAAALFRGFGATRCVEAWGDDVPRGKLNDFWGAVQATPEETVVFSWVEYPDRATRDAANARFRTDPAMQALGAAMPFDGRRLIHGGFAPLMDEGGGTGGYVDGFVLPVPRGRKADYVAMARGILPVFRELGALRVVEAWGDDVPEGQRTDFRRAVHATEEEAVVFAWIEYRDRAARDAAVQAMMTDERMKEPPKDMPFDGKRMIMGGFSVLLDA